MTTVLLDTNALIELEDSRRLLFLSRIARYPLLDAPPAFDDDYFFQRGWTNSGDNDRVDNTLLACVVEPDAVQEEPGPSRLGSPGKRPHLLELRLHLQPTRRC